MPQSQKTLEFLQKLKYNSQFFNVRLLSNNIAYGYENVLFMVKLKWMLVII